MVKKRYVNDVMTDLIFDRHSTALGLKLYYKYFVTH